MIIMVKKDWNKNKSKKIIKFLLLPMIIFIIILGLIFYYIGDKYK
jgi:L-lactate permease